MLSPFAEPQPRPVPAVEAPGASDGAFPLAPATPDGIHAKPGEAAAGLPPLFGPRDPHAAWKRVLLILGALVCFVLGVVGWLIPVVTGIPFYVLGLILLAGASERVRHRVNRWESQLPASTRIRLRRIFDRFHRKKRHPASRAGESREGA
jgi:hypothetical protein